MIRTFTIVNGKLKETDLPEDISKQSEHIKNSMWVDLIDLSDDERDMIESIDIKDSIPESDDMEELESSSRYFINNGSIHIHSLFLQHFEGSLQTATVAFILKNKMLLTYRDVELADFRLLRLRARRGYIEATTPTNIMVALLEQKVDDLADAVEDIYKDLEGVSSSVLDENEDKLEDTIDVITRQEDENGKIRMCLMDTQRSVTYLQRHIKNSEDYEICKEMLRDIETLNGHTNFLFEKVNFLMSAAQGFINIEQNQSIKTLSIATVLFLPSTLVASLYGMNFKFMPELALRYGYFFALGLMVLSTVITFWYFKFKKLL